METKQASNTPAMAAVKKLGEIAVKVNTPATILKQPGLAIDAVIGGNSIAQVAATTLTPAMQALTDTLNSIKASTSVLLASDAFQSAITIGNNLAIKAATIDFTPLLSGIATFASPYQYIGLLRRLKWPIFLIDSDSLREQIVKACQETDDENAVKQIVCNHFTHSVLDDMVADWYACPGVPKERLSILSEAVALHKSGHYAASVSMLMCQLYGVATDIKNIANTNGLVLTQDEKQFMNEHFALSNRMSGERKKLMQSFFFTSSGIIAWEAAAEYLNEVTLVSGDNSPHHPDHPMRNKVCHGDQLSFNTEEHSLKSILVIDMLIQLAYSVNNFASSVAHHTA